MGIRIWWPLSFLCTIIVACTLIFPSDLRLADLLGRAGRVQEAIRAYEEALQSYPHRDDLRVELGKLYLLNEEPEKAVVEFDSAMATMGDAPELLNILVDLYSKLGEKEKSVRTLERLVEKSPDDSTYRIKLAEAYEWNHDAKAATATYEDLLKENPKNVKYLRKLISLNLSLKEYHQTIRYLNHLLDVQPEDIEARRLLGDLYIETGQKDYATKEFEQILSLQPDNEALRARLAELYLWMQNYERGMLHYEYLVMHHVLNDEYFDKAIQLTRDLNPPKAIKYFRFRLNYLPRDNQVREKFVDLYFHLGYTEEAVEQLKILIRNNPEEVQYLLQLADNYQDLQEPELAMAAYEEVLKSGYADQEVSDELIFYYQSEKEFAKLVQLYETLIEKNLGDVERRNDYAEILVRTREYEQALVQYSELLELRPQNVKYRIQIAELCQLLGHDRRAFEIIEEGVQKYAIEDERYLLYAAQLYQEQRYFEKSLACYQRLVELDDGNLEYKKLLAAQYVNTKQFNKAVRLYEEALGSERDSIDLNFEWADLYWKNYDFDGMRQVLNDVKTRFPEKEFLNRDIGRFYFERGFFDEAIAHLGVELNRAPNDSLTLRMLGLAYAWNNEPAKARKILSTYHEKYPRDYYTHYQLGELLLSQDQKKQALDELQISLNLIDGVADNSDRESRFVRAKISAHQGDFLAASEQFESLIAEQPDDLNIYAEYAESLLILRHYEQSNYWISSILQKEPDHYRALRLQSRLYYERGDYDKAVETLRELERQRPHDVGLKLSLADVELASGDWYNSTKTLESVLRETPRNSPAQERLRLLRREIGEAAASDFKVEEQSGNFIKEAYNFLVTKATSSLLFLRAFWGEEKYSTRDLSLANAEYQNMGVDLYSRYHAKLQTSFGGTAHRNTDAWYLSVRGSARWYLNPSSSITMTARFNDLWNDPTLAAFHQGRLSSVQSDVNLLLWNRIVFWNRLSYEHHVINRNEPYGEAYRTDVQLGYKWQDRPWILTYYQFYYLKYVRQNPTNSPLIAIPESDQIHYLGAVMNRQLTSRFYYEIGGSLGFNTVQNSLLYYGVIGLEYTPINRLRFRSQLAFGRQNQLTGKDDSKSVSFDLYYFY